MKMDPKKKVEKRLVSFIAANNSEWQRIIENPDFMKVVKKLQQAYGLPIDTHGVNHPVATEYQDWMGFHESPVTKTKTGKVVFGEKYQRRHELEKKIKKLSEQFTIPRKFYESLLYMIIMGSKGPYISGGIFPSFNTRFAQDGSVIHECIITPETDLDNPLVIPWIKQWQSDHTDEIPQPMKGPRGRLDWRSVWEWHQRHPSISDRDIGIKLHKSREIVSRAFEALDKENMSQK